MCHRCFLSSASMGRKGRLVLLNLAAVICIGGLFLNRLCAEVEAEPAPGKSVPATKSSLGPAVTDFKTPWFRISKVVRIERALNALGIAGQFGKENKVGKYVELPKRLESSERGEHFIVTWKYSRKGPPRRITVKYEGESGRPDAPNPEIVLPPKTAVLKFDYKLSNEEHLETITKEYPTPRKGAYRLLIDNTGNSHRRRGRIEYWRVRIFADGELVAKKESFLWPVFRGRQGPEATEGS